MKKIMVVMAVVVVCIAALAVSCGQSAPCPPISWGAIATISAGDSSSIEIGPDTYAVYDDGSGDWCSTDGLRINSVPKSTANACRIAHSNCLAEVDLKPDNVKINQPVGTPYAKPVLSYDFSVHSTPTRHPESCQTSLCYAFYRLNNNPTPTWVYAGNAKGVYVSPKWYAQGKINHLSLYALVELPDPRDVARPRNLEMVVASDFFDDEAGGMAVAMQVVSDDLNELFAPEELIFHFATVDPGGSIGDIPPECTVDQPIPDRFTCLFPTGTPVQVILGLNGDVTTHEIIRLDQGYGQDFYSNPVEMFY